MRYWLMKSDPSAFGLEDLEQSPQQTTCWSGVRNYQARNYMRDEMQVGDQVLFYHSQSTPGIVAIAEVVREAYPDATAWDPQDEHFDPKSHPAHPTWLMVDLRLKQRLPRPLLLSELRQIPALSEMVLLRKGSRLSIQPVTPAEFQAILSAAGL